MEEKLTLKGIKVKKGFEIKNIYTFFSEKFKSNYVFEGERHDFWEIVCNFDGILGITAGKNVFTLKSGECFFHKPMEFHRLWAEKETEPFTIILTFSCNNIMKIHHGIYKIGKNEEKKLKLLLKKAKEIFVYNENGAVLSLKKEKDYDFQIFVNELENLMLTIIFGGYSEKNEIKSVTAEKYSKIIDVMEENISKRLSVEEIAKMCNLSVPNLKKIFKKYTGKGVMEYFSDIKTNRAKILLKDGKSVKEVSYDLGFEDQNYFNVFFKRNVGVSPGAYKKENEKNAF